MSSDSSDEEYVPEFEIENKSKEPQEFNFEQSVDSLLNKETPQVKKTDSETSEIKKEPISNLQLSDETKKNVNSKKTTIDIQENVLIVNKKKPTPSSNNKFKSLLNDIRDNYGLLKVYGIVSKDAMKIINKLITNGPESTAKECKIIKKKPSDYLVEVLKPIIIQKEEDKATIPTSNSRKRKLASILDDQSDTNLLNNIKYWNENYNSINSVSHFSNK